MLRGREMHSRVKAQTQSPTTCLRLCRELALMTVFGGRDINCPPSPSFPLKHLKALKPSRGPRRTMGNIREGACPLGAPHPQSPFRSSA